MGLDISHDAWHGAYSAFMRFRIQLAKAAKFPPLEQMQAYSDSEDAISWEPFEKHPLFPLLYHSDCDGHINRSKLKPLADYLESILPELEKLEPGWGHMPNVADKTRQFIAGCRLAIKKRQRLEFG